MKRVLSLLGLLACTLPLLAQSPQPLTIESIFADGGITGRAPETVRWSPDGKRVSFVERDDPGEHGALYFVDLAAGKPAVLVSEEKLATLAPPVGPVANERERERLTRYSVAGYQWAPDSAHLLFRSRGQLWLYSLEGARAVQLTSAPEPAGDPKISPDGTLVAYLRKHDLYALRLSGGREKQLTKTGSDGLLNGEVDWVYAEELEVRSNFFWSPDSAQIAFLEMNEKLIPGYPITDWIPQDASVDFQRYPKAGDPNPQVRVGIVKAGGGKVKWITVGETAEREYIPRFGWVRPGLVWVEILNRAQDKLELWIVDTQSGRSRRLLAEEQAGAWVSVSDMFRLLKGGRFLWPSWRDGHTHLYLYSFNANDPLAAEATLERQLTKGDFEVTRLNAFDEERQTVYFGATAALAGDPGSAAEPRERQLLAIQLDGTGLRRISKQGGMHEANFAPAATYYVDSFSAVAQPPSLSLCKVDGPCTPFWQARSVAAYGLAQLKFLQLKAADGATTIYASLLLPPDASGKVPLITNPYGGPGAQTVLNAWSGSGLFDQILARRGFAVLHVDNRGTAGRGRAFQSASRRRFGEVELADQLAALDQVLALYPQLDTARLGCWGWSYGGYMTLYAMTHSDRFRAGVAVAPVTDWRDYDSIYTERYMGLPRDNQSGYRNSSPVSSAKELKGRLLEVHGTSDDNVHLQNTMQMINAFIAAGRQFDLQLYPRKTHGIAGADTRAHLFHRIQEHFETYLMTPVPAAPRP